MITSGDLLAWALKIAPMALPTPGAVEVHDRRAPAGLRVPVGHPDRDRLLEPEHVAKVVGEVGEHRQPVEPGLPKTVVIPFRRSMSKVASRTVVTAGSSSGPSPYSLTRAMLDSFYSTLAQASFTLLALWWVLLQIRHDEWIADAPTGSGSTTSPSTSCSPA